MTKINACLSLLYITLWYISQYCVFIYQYYKYENYEYDKQLEIALILSVILLLAVNYYFKRQKIFMLLIIDIFPYIAIELLLRINNLLWFNSDDRFVHQLKYIFMYGIPIFSIPFIISSLLYWLFRVLSGYKRGGFV